MNARLAAFRSFYARYVAANTGVAEVQDRLAAAFETVPREDFVGPGPWSVPTLAGYIRTPSDDPAFLYQNILVALAGEGPIDHETAEGPVHNGEPSLHALCLAHANPRDGETVVHIGAGAGYYTAILASLVGEAGTVIAYEIDPGLAARAGRNLATLGHVNVRHQSGADGPLPTADLIYVSAGATSPLAVWLDALRPGGRLLFPLTPAKGIGGMLLVTVHSAGKQAAAEFISSAMFIPCIGARDDSTAQKLTDAFRQGGTERVKSLQREGQPDETCWLAGDAWWLSTRPVHSQQAKVRTGR